MSTLLLSGKNFTRELTEPEKFVAFGEGKLDTVFSHRHLHYSGTLPTDLAHALNMLWEMFVG